MEPELAHETNTKIEFLVIATLKFRTCDSGSEGCSVGSAMGRSHKTRGGTSNVQRGTWIPARRVTNAQHIYAIRSHAYIMIGF